MFILYQYLGILGYYSDILFNIIYTYNLYIRRRFSDAIGPAEMGI